MKKITSAFPWTEKEDAIIAELYPEHGWEPIAELTGRGKDAIKGRACKLEIKMTLVGKLRANQKQAAHMRKVGMSGKAYMWDGRPERSVVNDALAMRW